MDVLTSKAKIVLPQLKLTNIQGQFGQQTGSEVDFYSASDSETPYAMMYVQDCVS